MVVSLLLGGSLLRWSSIDHPVFQHDVGKTEMDTSLSTKDVVISSRELSLLDSDIWLIYLDVDLPGPRLVRHPPPVLCSARETDSTV